MKKCIVISDSFKGSLPSRDICAIARERIPLFFPACEVRALNVADGGEGTVDCFLDSCGGGRVFLDTGDALAAGILGGIYLRSGDHFAVSRLQVKLDAGIGSANDEFSHVLPPVFKKI